MYSSPKKSKNGIDGIYIGRGGMRGRHAGGHTELYDINPNRWMNAAFVPHFRAGVAFRGKLRQPLHDLLMLELIPDVGVCIQTDTTECVFFPHESNICIEAIILIYWPLLVGVTEFSACSPRRESWLRLLLRVAWCVAIWTPHKPPPCLHDWRLLQFNLPPKMNTHWHNRCS